MENLVDMQSLIFWALSIFASMIICKLTKKKRWLKSFLVSSIIIFFGKIIIDTGGNIPTNAELNINIDNVSGLMGQSFGFGLVTGSVGYWIGDAIFK